jgi:uncharacterized protein
MKLIFIALLILFIGLFLLKKFRKSANITAQQLSSNKILACNVCDTYIPENKAIIHNGKVYCSKEHLK